VEGGRFKRGLRWLGLAQPVDAKLPLLHRGLGWAGLDPSSGLAVLGGGLLFGLVHLGKGPVELLASFPGGVGVCYVTCRSRSIWPGWMIHAGEMVIVLAFALAMRKS
jgi:membrane protease YdiL (CAAX protease family)